MHKLGSWSEPNAKEQRLINTRLQRLSGRTQTLFSLAVLPIQSLPITLQARAEFCPSCLPDRGNLTSLFNFTQWLTGTRLKVGNIGVEVVVSTMSLIFLQSVFK